MDETFNSNNLYNNSGSKNNQLVTCRASNNDVEIIANAAYLNLPLYATPMAKVNAILAQHNIHGKYKATSRHVEIQVTAAEWEEMYYEVAIEGVERDIWPKTSSGRETYVRVHGSEVCTYYNK
ncbi:hypothetical protein BDR26DRAFT_902067 [Obelidium mucronatum]|nr:hypothetical protein BDR26DRAFT_902067 [Obelidium mucronatum]